MEARLLAVQLRRDGKTVFCAAFPDPRERGLWRWLIVAVGDALCAVYPRGRGRSAKRGSSCALSERLTRINAL